MLLNQQSATTNDLVLEKMSDDHIRVAVVGNVDAGKSTLIGTLTSSTLDDGRGTGRAYVMKHKHELESGRTSTIGSHLLGLMANGDVISGGPKKESMIACNSDRLVTLMDLAGHEKYLKTTITGVSRGMADYALVLVNAMQPPTHMTMHHLTLCVTSGIPVVVVMTKTDRCPSHVFQNTKNEINRLLRSPDIGLKPFHLRSENDIETVKDKLSMLTPVLAVSSVTGDGLDCLRKLLVALPKRRQHQNKRTKPFEFLVEDIFHVTGVGTVLSGFVNRGEWRLGETLHVGPLKNGKIVEVTPKSAHVAQTNVQQVWAGHSACFAVSMSKNKRTLLRQGMVALKDPFVPVPSFTAEVFLVKGKTVTISKDHYESTLHILHMKQSARVTNIFVAGRDDVSEVTIRQGGRATITFEFCRRMAYVRKGMKFIMRDGHVRGVGVIVDIPQVEQQQQHQVAS